MAASAGDASKQQWDEALTRLLDLSTTTVKRNAELENRVAELELEISVWKQAHSTVVDIAERDKKAHNAQISGFNKQMASAGLFKDHDPLILCVIDGDANVFNPSLLVQGLQGGRQAAQDLTKGIAEYLSQEEVQVFGRLSFWVSVYYNKRGLLSMIQSEGICTVDQFEAFISGLSQASPRFQIVDVGPGKEGADVKIKEYLKTYTCLPQTLRVFLGVGQDRGYVSTLSALHKEELLGKVVLLHGSSTSPEDIQNLPITSVYMDGLFMAYTPSYTQRRPGPIPLTDLNHNITTNGGLISPESETHPTAANSSQTRTTNGNKPIDPTKPLHKQTPPPCNEHYLMTCSKGPNCRYSHDWYLTPEQLEVLSKNAKKAPCNYLKNGLDCPYGDRCCWGHICPGGARCFHLSKGKCWFKGEAMHPVIDPQELYANM